MLSSPGRVFDLLQWFEGTLSLAGDGIMREMGLSLPQDQRLEIYYENEHQPLWLL